MRLKMLALMVAAAMGGTSTLATAAQTGPRDSGARPSVVDAPPPNYSDSMARLQEATQRLRQAIQAMAEQPAGDRRAAHRGFRRTRDGAARAWPAYRDWRLGTERRLLSATRIRAAAGAELGGVAPSFHGP